MKQEIMSIFTRTPLHVGAGNSVGAIDSPIQRERHTRIPIIPGSSLKGVLADLWNDGIEFYEENGKRKSRRKKDSECIKLFGSDDDKDAYAGALLIGEARVLAFPVRSAKGSFAWITCPLALARYERDSGKSLNSGNLEDIKEDECCPVSDDLLLNGSIVLEEYVFKKKSASPIDLSFISGDAVWQTVKKRLVIVNDEIFSYFVENACEVVTRIRVNDETGTVDNGALFNQERVPSETMFYAVIGAQSIKNIKADDALKIFADKFTEDSILQVGGDETTGLGYCSIKMEVR